MRADGTNARDLTLSGGNWGNVRWSPDSRYLVFDGGVEDSGTVNYQIERSDVRTGGMNLLTRSARSGNRDASFLAGGCRIAFSSGRLPTDYGGKVWLMDSDGANPVPVDTTRIASITVRPSPVRNEIFFAWGLGGESDAGVYRLDLTGTTIPAQPSSFHYVYKGDYFNLSQWSPDGEFLLFPKGNPKSDLYLLGRDGSTLRRLTNGLDVRLFSYAWSPDSRRLVFSASDDGGASTHLFTYDLITGVLRSLVIYRR
jgi:Tol biopolymer transport system component